MRGPIAHSRESSNTDSEPEVEEVGAAVCPNAEGCPKPAAGLSFPDCPKPKPVVEVGWPNPDAIENTYNRLSNKHNTKTVSILK